MNHNTIKSLQKEHGFDGLQELINNGHAWNLEGSVGRSAMGALESGACMLPKERRMDAYCNIVPSRDELKAGTKGTYKNSVRFWTEAEEEGYF